MSITALIIPILKAALILVIMAAMVLILTGIAHFLHSGSAPRDMDKEKMMRDMETRHDVITEESVFHELVKLPSRSASDGSKP